MILLPEVLSKWEWGVAQNMLEVGVGSEVAHHFGSLLFRFWSRLFHFWSLLFYFWSHES
jgi:hypothetical protein